MANQIEIIAIGNEILKGITINSNAAEIASALFKEGYTCNQHLVIPDDNETIKKRLKDGLDRKKIVITTGGLGPTCDDITRQAAAEVFDSPFIFNEELASELKQRYGDLPISLNDQATVPAKAIILKNPLGTAPGLAFHTELGTLILMPGVPKEMRTMLYEQVLPFLKNIFPISNPPISRSAHFFSLGESYIDPFLRSLESQYPHVSFGIYPKHGLLSVYATIYHPDENAVNQLETIIDSLKKEFSKHFFSTESEKIEMTVQQIFTENGWTLSTAESCTGGAIAARLTTNPGASSYFLGGVVSYSNHLKEKILGVDKNLITSKGAVSEETVKAMALGSLNIAGSDFSIAVSGVAGPTGGTEHHPVGQVWIAVAKRGEEPFCKKIQCYGNREMVIEQTVNAALGLIIRYAKNG